MLCLLLILLSAAIISNVVGSGKPRKIITDDDGTRRLLADFGAWTTATSCLPRADSGMTVGQYNGSIFLLGGQMNSKQMVEYDTRNNTFIDHGTAAISDFSFAGGGSGQVYVQYLDTLYTVDGYGGYIGRISTYNLRTRHFTTYWNDIKLPVNCGGDGCIAMNELFLFIVGGYNSGDALNTFQALNLSSNIWMVSLPVMNANRSGLSCTIHPISQHLYAIGGDNYKSVESQFSVEMINIRSMQNIQTASWNTLHEKLLQPAHGSRSVIYLDAILVIGGDENFAEISMINITTNAITSAGFLNTAVRETATIITNDTVYVFGGWNNEGSEWVDILQYLDLQTASTDVHNKDNLYLYIIIIIAGALTISLSIIIIFIFTKKKNKKKQEPLMQNVEEKKQIFEKIEVEHVRKDVVIPNNTLNELRKYIDMKPSSPPLLSNNFDINDIAPSAPGQTDEMNDNQNIDTLAESKDIEFKNMVNDKGQRYSAPVHVIEQKNDVPAEGYMLVPSQHYAPNEGEGYNEYEWIKDALRKCDNVDWSKYLKNFERHKITDLMIAEIPNNDEIWNELIPEYGIQFKFKKLLKEKK